MNRVKIANGTLLDGKRTVRIGFNGREIAYDGAGRRISEAYQYVDRFKENRWQDGWIYLR